MHGVPLARLPENAWYTGQYLYRGVKVHKIEGLPNVKPETCNYWWGLMGWWTDGNAVMFATGKANGGPLMPSVKKDWF